MFIIISIIAILVLYTILTVNKFNRLMVKIDESNSGIDVALTRRYDTLTKMLEVLKNYISYEERVIKEVIELRNQNFSESSTEMKMEIDSKINQAAEYIRVTMENYPELSSYENAKQLQIAILDTEDQLQAARRFFNSNISIYNQMLVTFPHSIIASIIKFKEKSFFEISKEKKSDVEMDF